MLSTTPLYSGRQVLVVDDDEELVGLTPKEFDFLRCLMRRAGRFVPYRILLQEVWSDPTPNDTHDRVRVTLLRLRKKLERDSSKPTLLQVSPGVGIRLDVA